MEGDNTIMGGPASTDASRFRADLYIEEPGPIAQDKTAGFMFFTAVSPVAGINTRVGTGSYVAKTHFTLIACGGFAMMERNDSAFTLARGKNSLTMDLYRTDTTDMGGGPCGYFMVVYISTQPTAGPGAANHTCRQILKTHGTDVATTSNTVSASIAPAIPETDYYITNIGVESLYMNTSPVSLQGVAVSLENTSGESGVSWENVGNWRLINDTEAGAFHLYADASHRLKKWPAEVPKLDIETARRWREHRVGNGWNSLSLLYTYHTVGPFTLDGTITGSAGGTVTIRAYRESDGTFLKSTSRSGNGAFSMNWWDNTESIIVTAVEDSTHVGCSFNGIANGSP
jgi:hypothetical protein